MRSRAPWFVLLTLSACIAGDERAGGVAPTTQPTQPTTEPTTTPPDTMVAPDVAACEGCTIDGTCIAPGTLDARNPCQHCDPSVADRWSLLDDVACTEAVPCRIGGTCRAGVCHTMPGEGCMPECALSGDCVGERCTYVLREGTCLINDVCRPEGADSSNACLVCDPQLNPTQWSAKRCGDGFSCTLDSCEAGECRNDLDDRSCFIDGRCVPEGEHDADDVCRVCDPDFDFDWSFANGTPCDDHDECTVDETCGLDGRCVGELDRVDTTPNDGFAQAVPLGTQAVTSFDNTVDGNINPSTDVDWYKWAMPFVSVGKQRGPHASLSLDRPADMTLCVLARCGSSSEAMPPEVTCPEGATDIAEGTAVGCCVTGRDDAALDLPLAATCPLAGAFLQGMGYARVSFPPRAEVTVGCERYRLKWGASEVQ